MPKRRSIIILASSLAILLLSFIVSLPTGEMIVSLDWTGLAMLFIMTLTAAGLGKEGSLEALRSTASSFSHLGSIAAFFTASTFILSPFISSLYAISMLLPMAISVLERKERDDAIPSTAAAMAIAAIAGGMILPGGSVHSMLIGGSAGGENVAKAMLPYFLASIPLVAISVPLLLRKRLAERTYIGQECAIEQGSKGLRMLYICFAFIFFLTSFGLFKWVDILIFTVAILLVFDRSVFLKADYTILVSAMILSLAGACLAPISSKLLSSGALWKSAVLSEIIGSLPAAALCSGSGASILEGVNIGGAGTLMSLPALVAFLLIKKDGRRRFLVEYTVLSILLVAACAAIASI